LIIVGLGVIGLYLVGINEIALLLGGALVVVLMQSGRRLFKQHTAALTLIPALLFKFPLTGLASSAVVFSQATLFLTFLKMGATLSVAVMFCWLFLIPSL
jgi:hypothetical protein